MPWFVYMLRCADGSLYTGITTNVARRVAEHAAGRGAKYTRGRGPLRVVYEERKSAESAARKREAAIKKMSKPEKELLCASVPRKRSQAKRNGVMSIQ